MLRACDGRGMGYRLAAACFETPCRRGVGYGVHGVGYGVHRKRLISGLETKHPEDDQNPTCHALTY